MHPDYSAAPRISRKFCGIHYVEDKDSYEHV